MFKRLESVLKLYGFMTKFKSCRVLISHRADSVGLLQTATAAQDHKIHIMHYSLLIINKFQPAGTSMFDNKNALSANSRIKWL